MMPPQNALGSALPPAKIVITVPVIGLTFQRLFDSGQVTSCDARCGRIRTPVEHVNSDGERRRFLCFQFRKCRLQLNIANDSDIAGRALLSSVALVALVAFWAGHRGICAIFAGLTLWASGEHDAERVRVRKQ